MTTKICIVYHSGYGHTAKQAAAVADGAREVSGTDVSEVPVEDLSEEASPAWEKLDGCGSDCIWLPNLYGVSIRGPQAVYGSNLGSLDVATVG